MTDQQQAKTPGTAIASLIMGIASLATCTGPLLGIPAVICGHIGLSRINNSGSPQGKGIAIAGLITGYIGIASIVFLAAIAVPSFVKARETSQRNVCINNMRQIDSAKEQAALVNRIDSGADITAEDISDYIKGGYDNMKCVKGGSYTINPVGQDPECSVHGPMSEALNRRPTR